MRTMRMMMRMRLADGCLELGGAEWKTIDFSSDGAVSCRLWFLNGNLPKLLLTDSFKPLSD